MSRVRNDDAVAGMPRAVAPAVEICIGKRELMTACVFCEIIAGAAPATIVRDWPDAIAFLPIGPVAPGHVLVVPRQHVANAIEDPAVTAQTMARAAEFAAGYGASNILTSTGRPATQSVFHLHIHVIPRAANDELMVPWGTTGDPQAPHNCKRARLAEAERDQFRDMLAEVRTA